MPETNKKIADKLEYYPKNVQMLATYAIEQAKRINAAALSQLLEQETKKLVRKDMAK